MFFRCDLNGGSLLLYDFFLRLDAYQKSEAKGVKGIGKHTQEWDEATAL